MNKIAATRPMVAIIGRANVGKSFIFNRLAGHRISIVHEETGITRDRIIAAIHYKNHCFDLVDTGGLDNIDERLVLNNITGKTIDAAVRQQVQTALREATAVVFVVDAQSGIMPADEKTAAMLHKSGLPVLLAANKTDHDEIGTGAFEKFGFRVFPVSALHNRGFENLLDELCKILPPGMADMPPQVGVAIVGRPNVGKSSIVNRLVRSERVIVFSEPGTTRDSIHVPLDVKIGRQTRRCILIDTAGIRQKKKISHAVEAFGQLRARESIAAADVAVLVIDAAQGPTAHDKNIAAYILAEKKGCVILVNKWDLMQNVTQQEYLAALYHAMPFMDFVPAVCASATTGFNMHRLAETVYYVADQINKDVSTSLLNQVVGRACRKLQPPLVKGGRLKIFYSTQVSIHPVSFLLFVNNADKIIPAYEKYLVNSLRGAFGFEGAPVILKFRSRKSKTAVKNPPANEKKQ
jgi:GTP-binding protein